MAGMRFNSTPAVIAAACLLASYQTGVQSRHLRSLDSAFLATDSNRDYTHLGCFVDNRSDRVLGYKLVDEEVDTELCYDYCLEQNAPFMATQWGIECWCATEPDLEYERHGEAEELCDYKCGGDNNEICGGYLAFDLYEIESFTTIKGSTITFYLGAMIGQKTVAKPTASPRPTCGIISTTCSAVKRVKTGVGASPRPRQRYLMHPRQPCDTQS